MSEAPAVLPQKVTLPQIHAAKAEGRSLVMITAYDTPSAQMAEAAGVDIVLVGDSAGTTVLGQGSTVAVSMSEMLLFTRAVARGLQRAFLVSDLPFGAYQVSDEDAVRNAIRLVKRGADAVKLEGAGRMVSRVSAVVAAGVPVMGHIGLTPQSATLLGGFRAQARTAAAARKLVSEAVALEQAGCFAIVLEAVPAPVAQAVTEAVHIPTIGIGAGPACNGQVLVWHDLLGLTQGHRPKFVKQYAELRQVMTAAIEAFAAEVRAGTFPAEQHTYRMAETERVAFDADGSAERQES